MDNLIGYSYRGKWGLLNIKNKKTSPAIYYKLSVIEGGYILACIKGNLSNQLFYGIIDSEGSIKISCSYFSIEKQKLHSNPFPIKYELIVSDLNRRKVLIVIMS